MKRIQLVLDRQFLYFLKQIGQTLLPFFYAFKLQLMFSFIVLGIAGGANQEYLKTAGPRVVRYFIFLSLDCAIYPPRSP